MTHINSMNVNAIELDAQIHLQKFYAKYDFNVAGQPYDDGGVMHVMMQVSHKNQLEKG